MVYCHSIVGFKFKITVQGSSSSLRSSLITKTPHLSSNGVKVTSAALQWWQWWYESLIRAWMERQKWPHCRLHLITLAASPLSKQRQFHFHCTVCLWELCWTLNTIVCRWACKCDWADDAAAREGERLKVHRKCDAMRRWDERRRSDEVKRRDGMKGDELKWAMTAAAAAASESENGHMQ